MPVQLKEMDQGRILEVEVNGKLTAQDYRRFVPEFERLVRQHGKISVLFDMKDFHGWDMGALWQDIKFDMKHFSDIDRLAMVGDKKWEAGMSDFCRPFTKASIRYFDQADIDEARQWITGIKADPGGRPPPPPAATPPTSPQA